jgi:hypothetical protein
VASVELLHYTRYLVGRPFSRAAHGQYTTRRSMKIMCLTQCCKCLCVFHRCAANNQCSAIDRIGTYNHRTVESTRCAHTRQDSA